MDNNKTVVAVSGYFNPLHKGHLDLFEDAKKFADKLHVIVNNDYQVRLKGRVPFMEENERVRMLEALTIVDDVTLSIDNDKTVDKTLEQLQPDFFANGGDRSDVSSIPELGTCRRYDIQLMLGVGGSEKIQSSSSLIESVIEDYSWVYKEWGRYKNVYEGDNRLFKILEVYPLQRTSMQYHNYRDEYWDILEGTLQDKDGYLHYPNKSSNIRVPATVSHQIINPSPVKTLKILEEWRGSHLSEADIVRLPEKNNYGHQRKPTI